MNIRRIINTFNPVARVKKGFWTQSGAFAAVAAGSLAVIYSQDVEKPETVTIEMVQDAVATPEQIAEVNPEPADEFTTVLQNFVNGIQLSKEADRDEIFRILSEHAQAQPDFKSQVSGFLENEDRPAIEIVEGQMFDPIQPLYQNGDDHEQLDEFTEENGILRRYRINRALLVGTEERETGLPSLAEFTGISQFSKTETIEVFDVENVISVLNPLLPKPEKPEFSFDQLFEEADTDLTQDQFLELLKG